MARFKCDQCGFDGRRQWDGERKCPACGETSKLRVAFRLEEMTEREAQEFEALAASLSRNS